MFCSKCGGKLENYASNCGFCGEPVAKYDSKVKYESSNSTGENSEVTSVGKWFLIPLINVIPVIGSIIYLILLFVWGLGHSKDNNPTFKNWARCQLLYMLIAFILIILTFVLVFATGLGDNLPSI